MSFIYKCWSNISWLPVDMINMEIFLNIFFIRHNVLILDKFSSFFKNSLSCLKNMSNPRMRDTSKRKGWDDNISHSWVQYPIYMSSTHLIYLTLISIFSWKFHKLLMIILYNDKPSIFCFFLQNMTRYLSFSCTKLNNQVSLWDISKRNKSPNEIWWWAKTISDLFPKWYWPKSEIHKI